MDTPDGQKPTENIVQASDLRKRYGEGEAAVDALAGVSVEFPTGRFAAIMGPSGSGKSTFLNVAAGLDRPTSGTLGAAASSGSCGSSARPPAKSDRWRAGRQR